MKRRLRQEAFLAVAKEAQPHVPFDEEGFRAFVAERPAALPTHAGDLLLVFAWSQGSREAQALLDLHLAAVPPIVAALVPGPAQVKDVLQELRSKLFAERRLLQYAGRGPLAGWLRRAALNTASKLLRPQRREQAALDPDSEELAPDPELVFLKGRYRAEFRDAFIAALRSLSPRERTLLRLNSLSNVSIDELGNMYRVHRATAARWVQRAREVIVERTRATLLERLALSPEELDELMAVMRSQLDVSLARHLEEP